MEIIKLSQKNFTKVIEKALEAIKKGRMLVCPTDTVYGLVCDAKNKKAAKRLFEIKMRQKGKAIPIFVKDIKMAKNLAFVNKKQEEFLKKVWFTRPNFKETWAGKGKVTVVLKKKNKLPKILFGRRKTIGLRIPNYRLVNVLLKKLNRPLTGTSANISGKPASTKIKEVISQFKNEKGPARAGGWRVGGVQPDLILDAGNLKKAKPSTVIELVGPKPKILRVGDVLPEKLLKRKNPKKK